MEEDLKVFKTKSFDKNRDSWKWEQQPEKDSRQTVHILYVWKDACTGNCDKYHFDSN